MTVVGNFPHADKGQLLRFAGHWDQHAKHGTQLKAIAFEEVVPQSTDAIAAYLASVLSGKGTSAHLRSHTICLIRVVLNLLSMATLFGPSLLPPCSADECQIGFQALDLSPHAIWWSNTGRAF